MGDARGKFITIEGLDGCGKTTQLQALSEELRSRGRQVVLTREPGGTVVGEKIRPILVDSSTVGLDPLAEMALMFAARAQHVQQIIVPALERGAFVLCDRFTDSTEAYQGYGRELGSENVLALHRILCRDIQPDLTILMDSDLGASLAKARRRNHRNAGEASNEDRFERESRAFFERVTEGYRAIAAREAERVFMVDARKPFDQVQPLILREVRRRFF
jgi:dTMP kinase